MIRFQTIDVEMPAIDYDEAKLWIDDVVKRHGKSVGELYYYFCSDDKLLEINQQRLGHDSSSKTVRKCIRQYYGRTANP